MGVVGVALRLKVERGGAWFQQGPGWGRGTHSASIAAAILKASTNHVFPDSIGPLKHLVTPGVVYDGDLHFLEHVGRWQLCMRVEGTEKDSILSLSSAIWLGEMI